MRRLLHYISDKSWDLNEDGYVSGYDINRINLLRIDNVDSCELYKTHKYEIYIEGNEITIVETDNVRYEHYTITYMDKYIVTVDPMLKIGNYICYDENKKVIQIGTCFSENCIDVTWLDYAQYFIPLVKSLLPNKS
jgi:hypothetical protein